MNWDKDWGPSITVRTGPGPPSIPLHIHTREVGSNSILLCWSAPELDGGLPVTSYTVRMKVFDYKYADGGKIIQGEDEDASGEGIYVRVDQYFTTEEIEREMGQINWGIVAYSGRDKCTLVMNLKPHTVYMFRIAGVNMVGEGKYSHRVCIRTLTEVVLHAHNMLLYTLLIYSYTYS